MRFDYRTFHIDCTARHDDDGQFYAHARITHARDEPTPHLQVFESGDLDGFANEWDAVHCARAFAIEWCDEALA